MRKRGPRCAVWLFMFDTLVGDDRASLDRDGEGEGCDDDSESALEDHGEDDGLNEGFVWEKRRKKGVRVVMGKRREREMANSATSFGHFSACLIPSQCG